jgi:hypothetical protein
MAGLNGSGKLLTSGASNQRGTARIAPIFAILLLVALGALAAPPYTQQRDQDRNRDQYRDQDRDRDRDRDQDRDRGPILILSYDRTARDFGGGDEARRMPDANCDPGFVAVGFHMQAAEYLTEAWLDCAPMRSDGSLGEERRISSRTGAGGGSAVFDARCSRGRALRGVTGRTGSSIDEIMGQCSYVRDIAERMENPSTELTTPATKPRAAGRPTQGSCPVGSVVTGFRSTGNNWLVHLWVLCSDLQRSY